MYIFLSPLFITLLKTVSVIFLLLVKNCRCNTFIFIVYFNFILETFSVGHSILSENISTFRLIHSQMLVHN